MNDTIFGPAIRTRTLIAVGRLQRTYIAEVAKILNRRPLDIRRAVTSLERAGVIVTTRLGNTRILELNPRLPVRKELYSLLLRLSETPEYAALWTNVRRRPRALGKPL
ncbi:MAG TPA: hypothetical protein VGX97_07520 [bacterium]|nr:hypothetical protein [bacterium]